MLHARTVVTACRVAETWLARLRRINASYGEPRRAVGDRALNRGQVSREVMHENYLRTYEKCKCEYQHDVRGHASRCVVRSTSKYVCLARTRDDSAHARVSVSRRMHVPFNAFDISIRCDLDTARACRRIIIVIGTRIHHPPSTEGEVHRYASLDRGR